MSLLRSDDARKLVYYQDEDGMCIIHTKLPAEAGALVVKAIESVANPVQHRRYALAGGGL